MPALGCSPKLCDEQAYDSISHRGGQQPLADRGSLGFGHGDTKENGTIVLHTKTTLGPFDFLLRG